MEEFYTDPTNDLPLPDKLEEFWANILWSDSAKSPTSQNNLFVNDGTYFNIKAK